MSDWQSFLASRGARLDPSGVASFGDARAELVAARDATIVADLSHNALLAVTGDDAQAFLHGQLTNDLQHLPDDGAQWTGWCSPKGRLLATFLLVRHADGYLLMLPAEIAEPIARRLRMFVLRSKVKIDAAGERYRLMGVAGKDAASAVGRLFGTAPAAMRSVERDGSICAALDGGRFVIFAASGAAATIWDALAQGATPAGRDAWEWTSIRAGIPAIVAKTQEEFVPQMANFDLVGGVSFKKGCYPGQEIVARTQYRGILKKRMALAHLAGGERPQPGDSVYGASFGEQATGKIVAAAPSPEGGFDALVVAQLESLEADELRIGSPTGMPLGIRSRPPAAS